MVEREINRSMGVLRHPPGSERALSIFDCPSLHHSIKDASDVQWYVRSYKEVFNGTFRRPLRLFSPEPLLSVQAGGLSLQVLELASTLNSLEVTRGANAGG
jgi:hypothetical protein